MRCPNCGKENPSFAKFCNECAAPLGVPCADCGFGNTKDAKACAGCGRSLAPKIEAAAERRQITVLFSDIVGSTTLSENLDPEDLRDLYARYQSRCASIIESYEGHLAQYLGDGVLAYFGYPVAHENDAARAVLSALEILESGAAAVSEGHRLEVRIGIHTGLVVVGDVGAGGRREQLALGETPNIAARLQGEAKPGTLVVSDATRKNLAGQFALEDLGARTLKGLSRPVQIYRVVGKSAAASRFRARKEADGLTPFIGRENEVLAVNDAWEKVIGGQGQAILLAGEAGMGKSRLLDAAQQIAENQPHEEFQAECSPFQMNTPLGPIRHMLERRIGLRRDEEGIIESIAEFVRGRGLDEQRFVPLIAHLLSVSLEGRYPEFEPSPVNLIRMIPQLLIAPPGTAPVIILVEDLHWADPTTLDVLKSLVDQQAGTRTFLVCTTRPDSPAPWDPEDHAQLIQVSALSPDETRLLVLRILGGKPLPLVLLEEIVSRTAGIPLFIEAVTKNVLEAGILQEVEDRYELVGAIPPRLIPATVQDSLMARIDRLGPDRPVAQLAATIGRECSFELLQAVLDQPEEVLTRSLQHLVDLEMVSESGTPPNSNYIFKHALIQEAAYESLLRKTRQEFHNKIAEVLMKQMPGLVDSRPELIARHKEGAGQIMDAIANWLKAGAMAGSRFALRECVAHLQKVISLLGTLPEDDATRLHVEMETQLSLGQALTATYGWASKEVETAFSRAHGLCKQLDNAVGLTRALFALSGVQFMRGIVDQADERALEALTIARDIGNPALRIAALHTVIFPAFYKGEFLRACAYGEEALPLYTPEVEREVSAMQHISSSFFCSIVHSWALWCRGHVDQSADAERKAWAIVEELGVPAYLVAARGVLLGKRYLERDYAATLREADLIHAQASESGFLYWVATARFYRGWAMAMLGDTEAGLREMDAGRAGRQMDSTGICIPQWNAMSAEALWRAGRPAEGLDAIAVGLDRARAYGEREHEAELYRIRGELQLHLGDLPAADLSFRQALQVAQAQDAKMWELRASLALFRLQQRQSQTDEARDLLRSLGDWFPATGETPELRELRAIRAGLGQPKIAGATPD